MADDQVAAEADTAVAEAAVGSSVAAEEEVGREVRAG